MYGWIVDGISSLFEPATGQKAAGWPASVTRETRTPDEEELQRQDSQARPAKRNYQSVHAADSVVQNEPVEVKRRRRDVVLSFVKKTVAGIAGLLRLQSDRPRPHAEIQTHPVTLMGIDELNTSWTSGFDWRMDKPGGGGHSERANGGTNSSPPLMRKQTRVPERGTYREDPPRWRSLQLLPPRHTAGSGAGPPGPDLTFPPGPAPNRSLRSCLTVEQALKESDREHYRRLVEMVSEKYSKTQPLPFNRTKPPGVSLPQDGHRAAVVGRTCDSTPWMTAPLRASPSVFTWRDGSSAKQSRDRRGEVCLSKPLSGSVDTQPVSGATKRPVAEVDLSAEVAARLHLVDRETPAPPQTQTDTHTTHATNTHTTHATHATHTTHTTNAHTTHATNVHHSDEDIPRLTKDMATEVSRALAQSDPSLVLSSAFKLRITQRDLATLQESSWLNDEVINFYLSLVMERSSSQGAGLKVYSFSTFFFPKLRGGGPGAGQAGGHAAVRRWTKAVDIFLHDVLLVPLHLGVHWSLAVVDFKSRSVMSYDSMGQRHEDICSMLLLYLKEEHRVRKGWEMDVSKWLTGSLSAREIPQQKNGSDCGVFACKYADYIAQGRPLTFRQCHMPLFRKLMMWEILNQRLL